MGAFCQGLTWGRGEEIGLKKDPFRFEEIKNACDSRRQKEM